MVDTGGGHLMCLEYRNNARVFLLDSNDQAVGCGFICGPRQVITCTHVVRDALGGADDFDAVRARVVVSFATDRTSQATMRIVTSHPVRDGLLLSDITLLELQDEDERFPRDFRIASSRLANLDRRLDIAGVGASPDFGEVQIEGPTGQYSWINRVFVRASDGEDDVTFEKGCSGTPVYSDGVGLVGMAVERQADHTGFIIPIQLLRHVWRLADTVGTGEAPIDTIAGYAYRPSFAGLPFRHDVFVSYARDEASPDVAKATADAIADLERRIHRSDAVGTAFCSSQRTSDQEDMSAADRSAIQSSALLLIFLSRSYLSGTSCLAEVDAFFEQAKLDGRTAAHAIVCAMEPIPDEKTAAWPPATVAGDASGWSIRTLYAQSENFDVQQIEIDSLVGEIRTKLKALANQVVAVKPAEPPAREADSGLPVQLYLQSHPDPAAWSRARDALANEQFVVAPYSMAREPDDLNEQIQQDKERLRLLAAVDGYILIRANPDDPTSLQASLGLGALRRVTTSGHRLRWVLLNWVNDAGPALPPNMPLKCVSALDANWIAAVRAELGLS
jgi:hypothetical protein